MRHILPILLMLILACPGVARAESLKDQEQGRVLLQDHRGRLEARLAEQVRRIGRLKQNAPGVRRDFQLDAALKQNRQLADKLARLQQQLNDRTRALAAAYQAALAKASDASQRARFHKRLRALRAELGSPASRLVTDGQVSPLDSPEDLEEKADLLDDSREKLQRRLKKVKRQLDLLQHRKRLRRHGRAADDTPFDENSTARTARVKGAAERATDSSNKVGGGGPTGNYTGGTAPGQNPDPGSLSGTPTPGAGPPTPSGDVAGLESARGSSAAGGLGIMDVTDPALLRELSRPANQGGSLSQRIATLERADKKLKKVLEQMNARSTKLRQQAKQIRKRK